MKKIKNFKQYQNELYHNPYNPDEIWDMNEFILDDINDYKKRYKLLNNLIGKTIEFYTFYLEDNKIGPVKLYDYKINLPEDADYPGYDFFINNKKYGDAKNNIDYFAVDTTKPIKIIENSNNINEFNIFEDENDVLINPPEEMINLAINNNNKFIAYTDENEWFISDFLLYNANLLGSKTLKKIKQFSVIKNIKKRKLLRNSYIYDIENLKPFDFIAKYNNLFKKEN